MFLKRPSSKQSLASRDGPAARPATSTSIVDYLPELPQPTFITPSLVDANGNEDSRPASKQTTRPKSAAKKATAKRPATPAASPRKTTASKSTKPKGIDRPLTALSTSSMNTKVVESTPATSPGTLGPDGSDADVLSALHRIDATMSGSAPASHGRSLEQESLGNYADMPYNDRMAVLEKLIVAGVNDENFITLCEDVQSCWQRIGLGR